MIPYEAVLTGAAVLGFLFYAFGYWTGRCSKANPCPKCAFHVNEHRMVGIEAERRRVADAEQQLKLRHEMEHKGSGWVMADPDKFNCSDEHCARNRH